MKQLPERLLSIDVFRSITMLLMIFLLDSFELTNIPHWIGHADGRADGMGFADIIFPVFLFLVGLSLSFAIRNRLKKNQPDAKILLYILLRAAALIIMGFFYMNLENYDISYDGYSLVSHSEWRFLITISFFLIWLDYPLKMNRILKYILIGSGIALLLTMAYIYPNSGGLKPEWWGILGMIGWGYLVCALIFLAVRGHLILLIVAFAVFMGINILWNMNLMPFNIPIIGDASPPSLVMAGVVISGIYQELAGQGKDKNLWIILTLVAFVALFAAFMIRPYANGISKMRATPAWGLIAIGTGILVFELLIYLIDIKRKENWFRLIRPAGTSTLTCYLIPYIYYSVMDYFQLSFPYFLNSGLIGLLKSVLIAFLVIRLTGFMEKRVIRLKV